MLISVLTVIMIITILVSLKALNDNVFRTKMMYIPYQVHHDRQVYRTFTHLFVHADAGHLIFNMISLYFLGDFLVKSFIISYGMVQGQFYFGLLYFAGGLFATLIPFARNKDNPNYRSLGASGAVSAVIFAAIAWEPTMTLRLMILPFPMPAWLFGVLYLAFEFWSDKNAKGNIAHDAHIGGAIFGILFILVLNFEKIRTTLESYF